MPTRTLELSATAISAFKACPVRFRLGWREGLRAEKDTEGQRVGTTWHKCQEIGKQAAAAGEDRLTAVTAWLNECYSTIPSGIEPEAWEIERIILAYSYAGYLWYWQDDPIESIAQELFFDLPLVNPSSGRALPYVRKKGRIDDVIRHEGRARLGEFKSTTRAIDSGSSYWDRLRLDTQCSFYVLAARTMQLAGELEQYGLKADEGLISDVLYDVWHRPTIKPKKLTQADSKAFVETGEYCGQTFEVSQPLSTVGEDTLVALEVSVDGVGAEVELGKKEGTYAIRETPEMFGARLLADIQERPDFYFARRPVPRTDAQLDAFEKELVHIYRSMRAMDKSGHWFHNESQCEATFKCPYISLCYHGLDEQVCDGHTCPEGFSRRFTDSNIAED